MGNFWDKIKNIFQPENEDADDKLDLSIEDPMPLDEKFATQFSEGGGHFLYCENKHAAVQYLSQIIETENISRFICFDDSLQKMLTHIGANFIDYPSATADFNFISCESLEAYNGSIVLSSHNMGGRKISDLAENYIILADYDQIVDNLSEALQIVRRTKADNIPNGITSIGGVEADAMGSKTTAKNIYLLIVE